jgi:riboflavin kinase/FMN adenylyltransferase
VKAVVVGDNFRCGAGAGTGPAELREILPKYTRGSKVFVPRMYRTADGSVDSSTLVRNSLMQGRVSEVALLLGRNYALDLAHQPSRESAYPLLMSVCSFVQLLPPPGLYETLLIASDRSVLATVAMIDGEFLQLMVPGLPTQSVGGGNYVWPDRLESLLFIKELSSVC